MTAYVNPGIITWARERNGLTIEELAVSMKRDPDEIRMWESGGRTPSYTSLEELAYRHFHIPLAVFFFPEPPDIDDVVNKFRRLPDFEFARLSSSTLHIIRLAQGYQESLAELIDPAIFGRRIFLDLKTDGLDATQLAHNAREYIDVNIKRQFEFNNPESALKAWRHAIESVGVFTFKDSLNDRFISGFCLLHEQYPIVLLNNSNSFTRQIFTLIHELGHILYQIHGVTDIDEEYIDYMDVAEREIEVRCNKFAAEFLVPTNDFKKELPLIERVGLDIIPDLADKYSVSREVILRRLLDYGRVSQEYYTAKSLEWNRDYLRADYKERGGNYYLTRLAYLGEGFTRLVLDSYYQGRLSIEELGYHLNVNSKNISKLETYLER